MLFARALERLEQLDRAQSQSCVAQEGTNSTERYATDVQGAQVIQMSNRRDADAVPKSDRHALLDAIQRAIHRGEAA